MKYLIVSTLAIVFSCQTRDKGDKLFGYLYGQTFSVTDSLTVEFIDSTHYVILEGKELVYGVTVGQWRVESTNEGTYLYNNWNNLDSGQVLLTDLNADLIKFKTQTTDIEFKKLKRKDRINILAHWTCIDCNSAPPFTTIGDSLNPTYIFTADSVARIHDMDLRGIRKWRFSPSGRMIILSDTTKPADIEVYEILVLSIGNLDKLVLSRVDIFGEMINRKLESTRN